ncbi:hypothetical protein JCM30760_05810 [Thiomicrorhabdus hydrogeniphila]
MLVDKNVIQNKIYTIRGVQVMLDRDLADLYGVETKRLNEQVKRNVQRFPEEFMFQLTKKELEDWKSQNATSNKELLGLRKLPNVFTEQGVSMLSAALKSETAIQVSIEIIKSFVKMKRFINNNASLFEQIDYLESIQRKHILETDKKFNQIFNALDSSPIGNTKQGVFFNGQIFDAYVFVVDLIKSATKSIVLIDNYIDESVLVILSKRMPNIPAKIYTKNANKSLLLDLEKHNQQYPPIKIILFQESHDRFLIIDDVIYHIGASIKDLGKKWFAFSRLDKTSISFTEKLPE